MPPVYEPGLEEENEVSYGKPLIAPLFTLIISNAEGMFEFLYGRGLFWQQAADGSWFSPFWKWLDLQELQQYPTQVLSWWPSRAGGIIWWRASRVLSDYSLTGNFQEIIDEFPFFSFLLADLHPHVLTIPFAVLALGFTLNYLFGGDQGKFELFGIRCSVKLEVFVECAGIHWRVSLSEYLGFPGLSGNFLACRTIHENQPLGWSTDRLWEFLFTSGLAWCGIHNYLLAIFHWVQISGGRHYPQFCFLYARSSFLDDVCHIAHTHIHFADCP